MKRWEGPSPGEHFSLFTSITEGRRGPKVAAYIKPIDCLRGDDRMVVQGCAPYTQSNALGKSCNPISADAVSGKGIRAPENDGQRRRYVFFRDPFQ